MKVTSIETAVLHVPCPRPMSLEFPDHRMVAAFIDTDEGVRGFGYTLAFGGGGAEAIQVYLETRLKPLLIGEDPRMVGSGRRCSTPTAASAGWAWPATVWPRSTSRCG